MTKLEFNYLMKQISRIKEALLIITDEKERRKMFRRLETLKMCRDEEINRNYGVI